MMSAKILSTHSVQGFDELRRRAICVADVLVERGVCPGDRVALKAANSTGFVTVLLALVHTGASVVLFDPQQPPHESARAAERARPQLVVLDQEAQPIPSPEHGPEPVYVFDLLAATVSRQPSTEQVDFDRWRALPDALITWSSGSTGEAKGIVKSGAAMLDNLERTIAVMGYDDKDVLLPLLPFSHQYGLSLVLLSWLSGASLVIAPYRRLDQAVWMAGRAGATVMDATPATYRSLLNLAGRRPGILRDLDRVRMYCTGGSPLDDSAANKFRMLSGLPLLDGYGSTEMGNLAFATPDNQVGCGQPLPGVDLRVLAEDGSQAGPDTPGDLHIRTPDAFTGYLEPDGTVRSWGGGWYVPGDLAMFDEQGNLFVLGRKSAVHRTGYTLYPEVIERKAARIGVPVMVVPVPDERLGHRLVFLVEDADRGDPLHWRERICAELPEYEHPNRVLVTKAFPLNGNGKPDVRQAKLLLAEYEEGRSTEPGLQLA